MKLFAEISKTEAQADGTLKVWGYASSESVDSDGETITADAMKAALPDYMKFGAVREMHQPKAAGTAIEISVGDDGRTFFGAHVVDSEAVKKVNAGVYKGFSIGGKVTERDELNKSIIKGIKLVEISLVDRPANPEAVFSMFKADVPRTPEDDVSELADILDKGEITPADVLALVKAAKDASVIATKKDAEDKLAKGMGNVADLAYLLKQIMWIVKDQMNEAAREGDGSTVPAALNDWLSAGGVILTTMVTEEVAELIAGIDPEDANMGFWLADKAIALHAKEVASDVTKAGRALSSSSMKHIQSIHDASAALGACASTGAEAAKHDHADMQKLQSAAAEAKDAIAKAVDSLAKAEAVADALRKRVAALEAQPAPGKALLNAIAVSKQNDLQSIEKVADAPASVTTDPFELIKAAQRNPRPFSFR